MDWIYYLLIIIAIITIISVVAYRYYKRRPESILPIQYSKEVPSGPYYLREYSAEAPFNYKNPYLDGQSEAWRSRMVQVGKKLDQHNVTHAYFVHGTFVGDDPFDLIPALRRIYPQMAPSVEHSIRQKIKRGYELLTKDSGNYLDEYVDLFRVSCGAKTQCKMFVWSSANHHLARLKGALELIDKLSGDLPDIPVSRVLLFGHSHGGQTFALFSHLVNQTHLGKQLWELLKEQQLVTSSYQPKFAKLRKYKFDLVTMGTPYRYPWRLGKNMRLLQIINHRGKSHLAEKPLGFWKTTGGDYVQQWGIAGSDSLASRSGDREINRRLDSLLGAGVDPKAWLENLAKGMRVHEAGTCYLVDYKDASLVVPNFTKTVFGHGIYTKYETMLFNAELICEEFYSK